MLLGRTSCRGARQLSSVSNSFVQQRAIWATAAGIAAGIITSPELARAQQSHTGASDLETVTVTARRQEERLIDVPVAATVLSAADLDKYAVTDLTQIGTIAPGLNVVREPGGFPGAAISIRGIQNFGTGDAALEQPVSVIVDGIPVSRGYIVDAGFFDLANIQVLKGPQALFFGKDSPAGVVVLESTTPKPGDPVGGYARVSYGFLQEDPILEAAMSASLGDKLAVRLALRGEDMRSGYVKNRAVPVTANVSGYAVPGPNFDEFPATKQAIARFSAAWVPTEPLQVTLKYLYSYYHDNSANGSTALINCQNGRHPYYHNLLTNELIEDTAETCGHERVTYDGTVPAAILAGFPRAPADGKYYTRVRQQLASLVVTYRLPLLEISSNTGYYHVEAGEFDNFDLDVFTETPVLSQEATNVWSHELRAVTRLNFPVNFTFGGFFEHERRGYFQEARIFTLGPYPIPGPYFGVTADYLNDDSNFSQNYSIFAQARWQITGNTELAAGGRWTRARKHSDIGQPFQYADLFYANPALEDPSFTPSGNVYRVHTRYNNFSPEVTFTWHPTRDVMVYAAYKTGFLAGGVENAGIIPNYTQLSQDQITANLTYAPETNKGEEIGVKVNSLGGRLSADITLFHYIYDNLQIATYHPDTTSFTVGNAASSTNEGVDLNATFRVDSHLSLRSSILYVLNEFRHYPNAPCYGGQTCPAGTQDLTGTAFSSAPWEGHFGISYVAPVSSRFDASLVADLATFSRTPNINRQPETATEAHTLLNASLFLAQTNGPWQLGLIGTNLTDAFYASNVFGKPLGQNQDLTGVVNAGREVRLQAEYRF